MRGRLLGNIDYVAALAELRHRGINYDPHEVRPPDWNLDVHRSQIGCERPGPPEPGGVWETACHLVRDYEFTPPELVRAVYHRADPLLGRNLLLEGRFSAMRFYMGVRITAVIDETRPERQTWGWSYQTLEHHLERGKVTYEVVKHLDSGQVELVASCQSQRSPALGPILRLGWLLFGRRTQLRFYRRCGQRMRELVRTSLTGTSVRALSPLETGDLVLVPSGARPHPLDRFTIRQHNPAGEIRLADSDWKLTPSGMGCPMQTQTFPFRFTTPYRIAGLPFGITPATATVQVGDGELAVRFGLWRLRTALANVASTAVTGPFGFVKTAGPAHLSFVDRGLTMATNGAHGLCITFREPVPGIEPTGILRHPALTVTVADCQALAAALTATRGSTPNIT